MNKSQDLIDAETYWTRALNRLISAPRPLSQQERNEQFAAECADMRKRHRRNFWQAVAFTVGMAALGAAFFMFMPPGSGGPIAGAIFGIFLAFAAIGLAANLASDHLFRNEQEIVREANVRAYPELASAAQLDEITELVKIVPQLHEITREWLGRGPLSVREYNDLMKAKRVHERLVESRQADEQRQQSGSRLSVAVNRPAG